MHAHLKHGKKTKGLIGTVLSANKKRSLWLIFGVPFMSLCGIASPIGVRSFSNYLTPGLFYDCDRIFTDPNYNFKTLDYSVGVAKAGGLLWGYVLLILFS